MVLSDRLKQATAHPPSQSEPFISSTSTHGILFCLRHITNKWLILELLSSVVTCGQVATYLLELASAKNFRPGENDNYAYLKLHPVGERDKEV